MTKSQKRYEAIAILRNARSDIERAFKTLSRKDLLTIRRQLAVDLVEPVEIVSTAIYAINCLLSDEKKEEK